MSTVPSSLARAERHRAGVVWHLLTAEYPPSIGGVGDYTRQVARGLAAAGHRVHVWCARLDGDAARGVEAEDAAAGVTVHRAFERFTPSELAEAAREARRDAAACWLVQWVPHQFGWKAMNLALPLWLARRARAGDRLELMVHEGGLQFAPGRWRQNAAAVMQRLMLAVAVRAADQIWMSIPGWERHLRRVQRGMLPSRAWLPIPSNIPVVRDDAGVAAWRDRLSGSGTALVGHFGTFGGAVGERVERVVPALLARVPCASFALIGAGGEAARERIVAAHPRLAARTVAPGPLPARDVSLAVQACDVMVQPYPDGVSGRRTSTMVALAHGRAVVTNVGELSETIWHGGVVRLALDDASDMAGALAELLADDLQRSRLGSAGRALYESTFALERVVDVLRGCAAAPAPDVSYAMSAVGA